MTQGGDRKHKSGNVAPNSAVVENVGVKMTVTVSY